jgi:hypothetical protein
VAPALLLAAALGLHLGVTLPARRLRDEARDEFARGREERERLRARAAGLERRAAAARAPAGDAAAARALRLTLLRATEGLPLVGVRIAVQTGRGAVAARGQLAAEGRQADLLRAAGRLAEPSSGALLEQVALLEARGGGTRIEVEVLSTRDET